MANMISKRPPHAPRVLAIAPTTQGVGYVVLESPAMPVDWAIKSVRDKEESKALSAISKLLQHYRPDVFVLEEPQGSRRWPRIQKLLEAASRLPQIQHITIRRFPMSRVKKVFRTFRAETKYEIAHAVAQQLPELAPRLPRIRKPWMSQDSRMGIFDAAALALTYYHSRSFWTREVSNSVLPESVSTAASQLA